MQFLKRMFLLFAVNALILLTLSIAFQVASAAFGFQLGTESSIWIWYGVIGMGGAFINLAMSRQLAKMFMGVKVIDPNTSDPASRKLVQIVHRLATTAGLPAMPEVGIYDGAEINAFATGPSKRRSLVAVSSGLLQQMNEEAIEGVLGHEVTHIANGDMVTMTLIQGVINTMVLIIARVLASVIASQISERGRPWLRMIIFYALQIVLSILGSIVVCYFSRAREFRADAGGAKLAGRSRMLAGLKSLRSVYGQVDDRSQSMATLKISGHPKGFLSLLATHPPLEERIRRLENPSAT